MKVVVAGGSGALGGRVCEDLEAHGHAVVVLTRRVRPGRFRQVEWDGRTVGAWSSELDSSAVVNLAGELVDRRPTPANIELLTRSRVEPTQALAAASRSLSQPVPVWIQASTLAIYGDAGNRVLDESAPPASGPPQMAGVARAWEGALEVLGPIAVSFCGPASSWTGTPLPWIGSRVSPVGGSAAESDPAPSGSAGSTSTTGWPSCAAHSTPSPVPTSTAWFTQPVRTRSATPTSWRHSAGLCADRRLHRPPPGRSEPAPSSCGRTRRWA